MLKLIKCFAYIVLLCLFLGGLYLASDESLNPQIGLLNDYRAVSQEKAKQLAHSNNLFYALYGLYAPENQSIHDYGYHRIFKQSKSNKQLTIIAHLNKICDLTQGQDCVAYYQNHAEQLQRQVDDNIVLIQRFNKLQHHEHYFPLIHSELQKMNSTLPEQLSAIHRLMHLDLFRLFIENKVEYVIQHISQDVLFWRKFLSQAESRELRRMAIEFIVKDLLLYSHLLDYHTEKVIAFDDINKVVSPLEPKEKSFKTIMTSQWLVLQKSFIALQHCAFKDFIQSNCQEQEPTTKQSKWEKLFTLRQNSLQNEAYKRVANNYEMRLLDAKSYYQQYLSGPETFKDKTSVRLPLVNDPAGIFKQEIIQIHDLDAFFRLIKLKKRIIETKKSKHQITRYLEKTKLELGNPYTGEAMVWDPVNQSLSFTPQNPNHQNFSSLSCFLDNVN